MNFPKYVFSLLLATAVLLSPASFPAALAQTAPSLGTAANFAALGGTGVTCTLPNPPLPAITISGGDVGSFLAAPSSVTGFPGFTPGATRCSLSGTVQLGGLGTVAAAGYADFIKAYGALAAIPCPTDAAHNLSGDLGGMTLSPGVYCISGVGLLTSQLTLSGGPTDIWIFKAASSLTPKNGSVVMTGGGQPCNVYWQVATAVDLLNTAFVGNVLAGTAITFTGTAFPGTASSLVGRALAFTDVTMTGANIAACAAQGRGHEGGGCDLDDNEGHHHDNDKGHHHDLSLIHI